MSTTDALPAMAAPSMPPAVIDRAAAVHAKLLQLAEALSEFELQIQHGGADGMMGWHDILSKYSLLTSYTHSVFDLLVTPPSISKAVEAHKASTGAEKPAYKTREEQKIIAQQEADAWRRTLAQSLIHPGKTVAQDRDWVVNNLLRTKQIPEVEKQEAELLSSVPSITEAAELYKSLKMHEDLTKKAHASCKRMRERVDDREFNWKARPSAEEDEDEDDDDEEPQVPSNAQPKYTTQQLVRFMRTGQLQR